MVIKNWDPLVFFPALAMERIPGLVCFNLKFSSAWGNPFRRQLRLMTLVKPHTFELLAVDGLSTGSVAYQTIG